MINLKEIWDDRYSNIDYAYGTLPNKFFKKSIEQYNLNGDILLPAEGEGRNAVYAAKLGLNVTAFDISQQGKNKALKLAEKNNVKIRYEIGDFLNLNLKNRQYDVVALIFAHFSPLIISDFHKSIGELLKEGGIVILEGFSKNHFELRKQNPNLGGPNDIDMLFSLKGIKNDFFNFEALELQETEILLNEGKFHNGVSRVVRYVGKKKIFFIIDIDETIFVGFLSKYLFISF